MKNMPMLQVIIQRKKLLNSLIRSQTQYLIICFIKQLFVKTKQLPSLESFSMRLCMLSSFFNQCLPAGPNLNPDVLDALLGFRFHKIAINADIKMAYLQITLDSADRDAIRFLYIENFLNTGSNLKLKTLRMTTVLFGAKPSSFMSLSATIKHDISKHKSTFPEIFYINNYSLYVDNCHWSE